MPPEFRDILRPVERNTQQRRAILRAFLKNPTPLSPQELLRTARPYARKLGIATVYRSIKSLIKEGALVAVKLPGAPDRYEPAGKHHHHHFECSSCGRIFEVEGCRLNPARLAPRGMRVDRHEVFLYGTCRTCAG